MPFTNAYGTMKRTPKRSEHYVNNKEFLEAMIEWRERCVTAENVGEPPPPVTDYIDPQGLVKEIIKILGIPAKVIRSDTEVQQINEEKQAAQQQQMDMMNAMQESQVAKNVAPAVKALDEANRQQ